MHSRADPVAVISVVRTGGLAGLRREWSVEIQDEREWARWRPLVEACPWDAVSDDATRDRFVYVISAQEHTARVPETHLTGPWRELADRVRDAHGRHGDAD